MIWLPFRKPSACGVVIMAKEQRRARRICALEVMQTWFSTEFYLARIGLGISPDFSTSLSCVSVAGTWPDYWGWQAQMMPKSPSGSLSTAKAQRCDPT